MARVDERGSFFIKLNVKRLKFTRINNRTWLAFSEQPYCLNPLSASGTKPNPGMNVKTVVF